MKVFNWVQRRLLNVHSCTNFPQENGELEDSHDAHMVVNMLDHWNDGILAIGTLAIGPLENCDEYDIIEEVNDGHDKAITNYVHDQDVDIFSHELEKFIGANHEITEEEVVEHEGQTNKRRVTLADLFLEDPDHYHPVQDDVIVEKKGLKMIIKPTSRVKNRLSKAKKLVMEELHPLKKFNKLVKRIMKKKIYPDLEGKTKDNKMQQSYNSTNEQDVANHDSASLLLVQGNMV
ncbi:hypothetical protein BVRB_1g002530 [Beta vulgaris subsp. vulgaris]|nr:hypothetical protein BVRB_1g002530 [Beta vulgaris subsp. vulgaris]